MTSHESDNNLHPSNLSDFESFERRDENTTDVRVLLTLASMTELLAALEDGNLLPTERQTLLEASIRYASMNSAVTYRIEGPTGAVLDTVLPDSPSEVHHQLLQSTPETIRRLTITLDDSSADALQSAATTDECLMGDILTSGIRTRNEVKKHYRTGRSVIGVQTHSDEEFAILPIS